MPLSFRLQSPRQGDSATISISVISCSPFLVLISPRTIRHRSSNCVLSGIEPGPVPQFAPAVNQMTNQVEVPLLGHRAELRVPQYTALKAPLAIYLCITAKRAVVTDSSQHRMVCGNSENPPIRNVYEYRRSPLHTILIPSHNGSEVFLTSSLREDFAMPHRHKVSNR
jgi:hypothetical protein